MKPTLDQVTELLEPEVNRIVETYERLSQTQLFFDSTSAVMAATDSADGPELAHMVHWAQIKRPNLFALRDAIRSAYLADRYRGKLTDEQAEVLAAAWDARLA